MKAGDPDEAWRRFSLLDPADVHEAVGLRHALSRWGLRLLLFAAAATPVATLAKLLNWPDQRAWDLGVAVPLVLGAVLHGGSAWRVNRLENRVKDLDEKRARSLLEFRREKAQRLLEDASRSLLLAVSDKTQLGLVSLGCSVYQIPKGDGQELERLARCPTNGRPASGVKWTRGKGVVGQVWDSECEIFADVSKLRRLSNADFDAADPKVTLGMSKAEVQRTSSYNSVWATTLRDTNERLIGVLSVDCNVARSVPRLNRASGDTLVGSAVAMIRHQLEELLGYE